MMEYRLTGSSHNGFPTIFCNDQRFGSEPRGASKSLVDCSPKQVYLWPSPFVSYTSVDPKQVVAIPSWKLKVIMLAIVQVISKQNRIGKKNANPRFCLFCRRICLSGKLAGDKWEAHGRQVWHHAAQGISKWKTSKWETHGKQMGDKSAFQGISTWKASRRHMGNKWGTSRAPCVPRHQQRKTSGGQMGDKWETCPASCVPRHHHVGDKWVPRHPFQRQSLSMHPFKRSKNPSSSCLGNDHI